MTKILNIKDSSGNYLKLSDSNIPYTIQERAGTTTTGTVTLTGLNNEGFMFLKWHSTDGKGGVALIYIAIVPYIINQSNYGNGSVTSAEGLVTSGINITFNADNVTYSVLVY